VSPEGTNLVVAHSLDYAATWSAPVTLDLDRDAPLGDNAVPLSAGDGQGRWAITWSLAGEAKVAFSSDQGATWTVPVALNPDTVSGGQPGAIVSTGPDQWLVAWSASLGGDYGSDKDILLTRLAYPDRNHNGVPDDIEAESRPTLPCGLSPLVTGALVLLVWVARAGARKPA
jgi:hypothetical protein